MFVLRDETFPVLGVWESARKYWSDSFRIHFISVKIQFKIKFADFIWLYKTLELVINWKNGIHSLTSNWKEIFATIKEKQLNRKIHQLVKLFFFLNLDWDFVLKRCNPFNDSYFFFCSKGRALFCFEVFGF